VEQAADPAVLAIRLAEAEVARHVEVLRPVEIAVHLDRADDEVGAAQCLVEVRCRTRADVALQPGVEQRRVPERGLECLAVPVHEDEVHVAPAERLAEPDVAHGRRPERPASRTDEHNAHRNLQKRDRINRIYRTPETLPILSVLSVRSQKW
jgi:hypothetical protein